MKDLEINVGIDSSGAEKGIDGLSKSLNSLVDEVSSAEATVNKVKEALFGVGDASKISAQELKIYDEWVRRNTGQSGELAKREAELARRLAEKAEQTRRLAEEQKRLQSSNEGLSRTRDANVTAITRQVAAQRAALSTTNNLTRTVTQITSGTGNWSSSLGVAARQLALLSTSAASTGITFRGLLSIITGPAGLAIGISAAVTATTMLITALRNSKTELEKNAEAAKKAKQELDAYVETLSTSGQVSAKAAESYAKEVSLIESLTDVIGNDMYTREQQLAVINELRTIMPDRLGNYTDEEILARKATVAIDGYTESVKTLAQYMAAQSVASDLFKEQAQRTLLATEAQNAYNTAVEKTRAYTKEIQLAGRNEADLAIWEKNRLAALRGEENAARKLWDTHVKGIEETQGRLKTVEGMVKDSFLATPEDTSIYGKLNEELRQLDEQFKKASTQEELTKVAARIKEVRSELEKLDQLTGKKRTVKVKAEVSKIEPLLKRSGEISGTAGMEGLDKQIKSVVLWYENAFKVVDDQINKGIKGAVEARGILEKEMALSISNFRILEASRVADSIARIEAESGIRASDGRAKQMAEIQAWYEREVSLAKGNEEILAAIERGRERREQAVNDRILEKEKDLWDKINAYRRFSSEVEGEASTSKLDAKYDADLAVVRRYFRELKKLADGNPEAMALLGLQEAQLIRDINLQRSSASIGQGAKASVDTSGVELSRSIQQGLTRGVRSAFRDLSSIGEGTRAIYREFESEIERATGANKEFLISIRRQRLELERSFGSIFSKITSNLTGAMNEIFMGILVDKLKSAVKEGGTEMSKTMSTIAASFSAAGNLISSNVKPTSTPGQTAGGALSGAASGALIGSVIPGGTLIGGVVGGLVGAIGGLFGSKKARKEEKLRQQQLEEQRKQTKLLERQNALAYANQITGRMVEGVGIINNFSLDAFGNIISRIDGSDIVLAYERTKGKNKKGT